MKYFLLLCVFILISNSLFSQESNSKLIVLEKKLAKLDDYEQKIKALQEIGNLCLEDNIIRAKPIFEQLLSLSTIKKDTVTMSKSLIELGYLYIDLGENETAINCTKQLDTLLNTKKEGYYIYLGETKNILTSVYLNSNNYAKALKNALIANQFFKKAKSTKKVELFLIENYNIISYIYNKMKNYGQALHSVEHSLNMSLRNEEWESTVQSYITLGLVYRNMGEANKSLDYYEKALGLLEEKNDQEGIATVLHHIGAVNIKLNHQDAAVNYFKKSIAICKDYDVKLMLAEGYLCLGEAYKNTKNPNSLAYIDSSLIISREIKDVIFISEALIMKAELFRNKKLYNIALKQLEENLSYSKKQNSKEMLKNAHKALYDTYKDINDTKNSLIHLEKYIQVKNSIDEELKEEQIKTLEITYNNEQLVSKLENKEMALQFSKMKQQRYKINNYFIIGILVLIFSFIIFLSLKKRKRIKMEQLILKSKQELLQIKKEALDRQVKLKNKRITDFALQIREKNDLLKDIEKQLKRLKIKDSGSKNILLDAMLFISDAINENKEKIQLYTKAINNENDSFEAKIIEDYGSLTEKEKKVATMIRIGKNSKQIATRLSISVGSVDNYRYNVRKKMKVPKGEPLETFIKNI